jgi:hypothetical protein
MKSYLNTALIGLLAATSLMMCNCKNNNAKAAPEPAAADTVKPAKITWGEGDMLAVAFIGYYTDVNSFKTSPAYKKCCARYRLNNPPMVTAGGQEVYLVIPRDTKSTVKVGGYTFDMFTNGDDPSSGKVLYTGSGQPFFLMCNVSDYMPNVNIHITTPAGDALDYNPQIDLNGGNLTTPGTGGVNDITEFDETAVRVPQSASVEDEGVTVSIKNGKVMLLFDPAKARALVESFNNDPEAQYRLEERPYVVEGLNGMCKGVYIGNAGQTINPILCMLMDDGTVHLLGIHKAMCHCDFHCTGSIAGLSGIVAFTQGSEDGDNNKDAYDIAPNSRAGSTLIIAIDKTGKKHPVAVPNNIIEPNN